MDHAREIVGRTLADLNAVADFGEGLAGVSSHTEIGFQELVALFGEQAEGRTTDDDGCLAVLADAADHVPRDGQRPFCVQVAVIAQVAKGDPDDIGPELVDDGFNLGQVVVSEHKVNNLDLVPVVVQVRRDIRQPDGHRLGVHPAVHPVLAVGGYEQDTHCTLQRGPSFEPSSWPIMDYVGRFYKDARDNITGWEGLEFWVIILTNYGNHN